MSLQKLIDHAKRYALNEVDRAEELQHAIREGEEALKQIREAYAGATVSAVRALSRGDISDANYWHGVQAAYRTSWYWLTGENDITEKKPEVAG
jgi:hypothetical protein